jgi:hypothetical protein
MNIDANAHAQISDKKRNEVDEGAHAPGKYAVRKGYTQMRA